MPFGIASDQSGNLFVGDYYNKRIRKVSPAGVVTTIAGYGYGASVDGWGTSDTGLPKAG